MSVYKVFFFFIGSSNYKEHPWNLWEFDQLPLGYWDDINNVTAFLDELVKHLNIKNLDDWYQVTKEQIEKTGYSSMLVLNFLYISIHFLLGTQWRTYSILK